MKCIGSDIKTKKTEKKNILDKKDEDYLFLLP